jgi:hypothetical protein
MDLKTVPLSPDLLKNQRFWKWHYGCSTEGTSNPPKGAIDETSTGHHVQESTRKTNPAESHHLQALRHANLLSELFEKASRSSR